MSEPVRAFAILYADGSLGTWRRTHPANIVASVREAGFQRPVAIIRAQAKPLEARLGQ